MPTRAKGKSDTGNTEEMKITFKCSRCGREKPIEDMRTVTRFIPVLIVCQDCARIIG
jgi:hypothetical protein